MKLEFGQDVRNFTTFIGVDLGGARGKTTAVTRLSCPDTQAAVPLAVVEEAVTRHDGQPWTDEVLVDYVANYPDAVVALDVPLTAPACVRCTETVCPGAAQCDVAAVAWLRTEGASMQAHALESDLDRIAVIPSHSSLATEAAPPADAARPPLTAYTHRCTEVVLHFESGLFPRDALGQSPGPLSARGGYLRRVLAARGFRHHDNLIEVSPRCTIGALFGERKARGYKRDADPWVTRASIVEGLADHLGFSAHSRMSREEVLRNDHCFDALISAYTAFLWARDSLQRPPDDVFLEDGWIYTPTKR